MTNKGVRRTARLDHLVLLSSAAIGFFGSVILYFLHTHPIIVSVFLATGVASLVYGFLGGIDTATFEWGVGRWVTVTLAGSIAALVGTASVVYYPLRQETRVPTVGQFEWQWAGDGWRGYLTVLPDGKAEIDMKKFMTCNGILTDKPLLRISDPTHKYGTVKQSRDGTRLDVNLPRVTFIDYDANCNGTERQYSTAISGTLDKAVAYAGRISYTDKYQASTGDMILVRYVSH